MAESSEARLAKCQRRAGTDEGFEPLEGEFEVAALLDWPQTALEQPPQRLHVTQNLHSQLPAFFPACPADHARGHIKRLYVTTAYTGLGTVEHCVHRLTSAALTCQAVVCWSGFEMDPRCREVILASKHAPEHLFDDIQNVFDSQWVMKMHACAEAFKKGAQSQVRAAESPECGRERLAQISQRCMLKLFEIATAGMRTQGTQTHAYCWKQPKLEPGMSCWKAVWRSHLREVEASGCTAPM